MKKFVTIIFLLFSITVCLAHPVHLTVTNVEIDTKTGKATVLFKIFTSDLQDAISHWKGIHLSIEDVLENKEKTQWIHEYINNNFSISTHSKLPLIFTESKMEGEYTRLMYKFEITDSTGNIEIFNSLLIDLLPDQSNLVILTINGKDKGLNYNAESKVYSTELM